MAKIMLAHTLVNVHEYQRAINLYKMILTEQISNTLDQRTKISTHLKLIKLICSNQQYDDPHIHCSLLYLQQKIPTSPQLVYYKSLILYSTKNQISSKELSQLKINLHFCLNQLTDFQLILCCSKLILKLHIDYKDLYGAQQIFRRFQQESTKQEHLKQWRLLIEGANDIIKRKVQQGKDKLEKCLQFISHKQKRLNKQRSSLVCLTSQEILYLRFHVLQYLAFISFEQGHVVQSIEAYQHILELGSNSKKDPTSKQLMNEEENHKSSFKISFKKRYFHKFKQIEINLILVQAIMNHKINENFLQEKRMFQIAIQRRQTPQTIFMWVINQIAIFRSNWQKSDQEQLRSQFQQQLGSNTQIQNWSQILSKVTRAEQICPSFSIIYFFHSLILLYLKDNNQALQRVQMAIKKAQQPISEYHFIEALCFSLISEETRSLDLAYRGIDSIDKAILIDGNISQFYKERSKHFFCLGKYQYAIDDCQKCDATSADSEAKLLAMFYHYTVGNYKRSQMLLVELVYGKDSNDKEDRQLGNESLGNNQVKEKAMINSSQVKLQQDNQHSYKQFQQALMFRLKKYEKTGMISNLLLCLSSNPKEEQSFPKLNAFYLDLLNDVIQSRRTYSQFTVYFIELLLACYYMYQQDYVTSMNYLFDCLQEIHYIQEMNNRKESENSQEKEQKYEKDSQEGKEQIRESNMMRKINTDSMLNQIKYNIVIANLLRNHQNQSMFAAQSENQNHSRQQAKNTQKSYPTEETYKETLAFVDRFMKESASQELVEQLSIIKKLILSSEKSNKQPLQPQPTKSSQPKLPQRISIYIKPFFKQEKFSDSFHELNIPIGDKYILVTKLIVFYPTKLSFNIRPQFDPAFLFNFDIDKVQNQLAPPWFKFANTANNSKNPHCLIFTDQLRNESIAISSTQRQPSIHGNQVSYKNRCQDRYFNESQKRINQKNPKHSQKDADLKQLMRLDSKIEKKLQRLFPK